MSASASALAEALGAAEAPAEAEADPERRARGEADPAALGEMMALTRRAESALRKIYQPDGLNIGMNVGRSAGAGVAGHIHMHVLPRWHGDVSFMTTVAETRVLPEDLAETYRRLLPLVNAHERE